MLHNLGLNNGAPIPGNVDPGVLAGIAPALAGLVGAGGVKQFRAMGPLPDEAQRLFDKEVVRVKTDRLNLVSRLMELGLTFPLPNWMGVPSLYWERSGRSGTAINAMNPSVRGSTNLDPRDGRTYPVYCQFDDFDLTDRLQATSLRAGTPLDVSMVGTTTRNVHELIEKNGLDGGPTVQGNSSPGFLNAPNINSYIIPLAWDDAAKTGPLIKVDVRAMIAKLRAKRFFGPFEMLVSTIYEDVLNELFFTSDSGSTQTIRSVLGEMMYEKTPLGISTVDYLADDTVLIFQTTEDVARVVIGQQPVPLTYQIVPFVMSTIVLASMFVQVRDTHEGTSGIVKGTL